MIVVVHKWYFFLIILNSSVLENTHLNNWFFLNWSFKYNREAFFKSIRYTYNRIPLFIFIYLFILNKMQRNWFFCLFVCFTGQALTLFSVAKIFLNIRNYYFVDILLIRNIFCWCCYPCQTKFYTIIVSYSSFIVTFFLCLLCYQKGDAILSQENAER